MVLRKQRSVVLAFFLSLALGAVLASCATPTPTPVPPTPVPTPTPLLATQADQIVGTWQGTGAQGMYQQLNPDGTWLVAVALDSLPDKPDARMVFQFEGTQLTVTEVEATGLPACAAKSATYHVELMPNGNIRFVRVKEACTERGRSTAQEHRRVR